MTEQRTWRAARPVMGAAAALALAGCAATHVGEDWQCPLAQGDVCASVAAADPAVPGTQAADELATRTPLYRVDDAARAEEAARQAMPERRCAAGCDPLAWLAGLLSGGAEETPKAGHGPVAEAAAAGPGAARSATLGTDSDLESVPAAEPSKDVAPAAGSSTAKDLPEGAASPALADAPAPDTPVEAVAAAHTAPLPGPEDPSGEDLRVPETIGRVWIAPFVDAGGLYREGSWVRVVIAPGEWRVR